MQVLNIMQLALIFHSQLNTSRELLELYYFLVSKVARIIDVQIIDFLLYIRTTLIWAAWDSVLF